jgi:hypothetical protein
MRLRVLVDTPILVCRAQLRKERHERRRLLIALAVVLTLSILFASSARATAWTVGRGTFTIQSQTNTVVGQVDG